MEDYIYGQPNVFDRMYLLNVNSMRKFARKVKLCVAAKRSLLLTFINGLDKKIYIYI